MKLGSYLHFPLSFLFLRCTHSLLLFLLKLHISFASAFVRRLLVVRKDLFLEDVGDSPKSENVECASNVDDEESIVPLGIGFSDTAFENCGMAY